MNNLTQDLPDMGLGEVTVEAVGTVTNPPQADDPEEGDQ